MKSKNPLFAVRAIRPLSLVVTTVFCAPLAMAANLYWDTNGDVPGSGNAGGLWDATSFNWNTDAAGGDNDGGTADTSTPWTDGNDAVFSAGTDGIGGLTITVDGTVDPNSITFAQDGNKTLTGGSITTAGGLSISSAGRSNGNNYNIQSLLTGTGDLVLSANGNTADDGGGVGGNLTLGNNANDFTGNVTIQSGVVNFSSDAAFGNAPNTITINGGGLVCTAATNSLAATRQVILAGGGNKIFRVYGSSTFTVNGVISGSGAVRHTDGGTLVLNGANTFTGNIDNVKGNLTLSGSAHTGNVISYAGTYAVGAGNTYTGYTNIRNNGSVIRLDADNGLPDGTAVVMWGSTTFNANGKTDTFGSLSTGSAGDTNVVFNLGAGANLTLTGNGIGSGITSGYGNAAIHGKITGTGNITYAHATAIASAAQWDWFNTTNDFTGTITITQGRLRAASNATTPTDSALGNAENDIVFNGDIVTTLGNQEGKASLQVANGTNLPLGVGRTITINSGKEGTFYVWGSTTNTVNGKITGGGNLRKEDGGLLLLNNATNDYAGETKVVAGELRQGLAGAIPSTTTLVVGGGICNLNGIPTSVNAISAGGLFGGNLCGGTTLTVTGNGTYEYTGRVTDTNFGGNNGLIVKYAGTGSLTLSGNQDNSGGRAVVGSGILVLAKDSTASVHAVGTNNIPGLTISGGTCRLAGTGGDQIYLDANVDMSAGTFDLNERSEGFRGLTGSGGTINNSGAAPSTLTVGQQSVAGNVYTFAGVIEDGVSGVNLTKTGAGTQVLTGVSTYTGATTVNAGTLQVDGTLGDTPTLVLGTLSGNGSISDTVNVVSGGGLGAKISDWTGTAGTGFTDLAVEALALDPGPHPITLDTTGLANFTETGKTFPILTTSGGITGFDAMDFTVTAPGFAGTGTWSVQQAGNQLELVYSVASSAYDTWAAAKGLTAPIDAKDADPDGDGRNNLLEFALDGDPLSSANDGKMVAALADPDGAGPETSALVLTLPVRDGAVFSGPGDLVSGTVDGLVYRIQGSDDLADFTGMDISEVTPALTAGLPTLSTGWTYRSFRTPGQPSEPDPRDFIRAAVEEVPNP
ncbi:MAG: autotransporter-associated beta strand repeat-containing protein [Verrucomicrobia bacterium]|nr:autotransporter-associated beta strand repeat-containing protein [Verrucomicrobiota bacterium]